MLVLDGQKASLHSPLYIQYNRDRCFARPTGACLRTQVSGWVDCLPTTSSAFTGLRVHIIDGTQDCGNRYTTSPHLLLGKASLLCSYALVVCLFVFLIETQDAGLRRSSGRYRSCQIPSETVMMFRSTGTRSLLKSISRHLSAKTSYSAASLKFRNVALLGQLNNNTRPRVPPLFRPTTLSLLYATKPSEPLDRIDREAEKRYAQKKLESHPESVSTQSSVRHVLEGSGQKDKDDEMLGSIKDDIKSIKDTFGLKDVPRESLLLGIAGVLPYAVTSLGTVFLAYDLNHTNSTGQELLFSPETAHYLMDMMLPIQIGYGAVVSSQSTLLNLQWSK